MNIYGKKVFLRAMEKKDGEMIIKMFNDNIIENLVVGWAFPVSSYYHEKWLESNYNDDKNFRFIIETKDEGSVGVATLTNLDWKNRRATHGIKLFSSDYRKKGIGTDTVMAIMRYSFDELGLHRLDGAWLDYNIASKRLFTKCGWKEEGVRKEFIFKGGKYHNLIISGVLASDYYKLIEENHYWD